MRAKDRIDHFDQRRARSRMSAAIATRDSTLSKQLSINQGIDTDET